MKIAHTEVMPVVMAKEDREWRFALRADPEHRGFILKLTTDDGFIGLGYATGSAHVGVQAALELYGKYLIGQDPFNTEKVFWTLDRAFQGNEEAKDAIDFALHDLQAKALGLPLYALLGGLMREEIPVIRILALKEPEQMAANALKLVSQGYSYIKIKLDGNPKKDLARVREIRKAVGETLHLTVDCNQSYMPKLAIDTLKRMHEFGIDLCEQPVRADDWQGLAAVTRSVDCVVEAHESAKRLENIIRLVNDKIVDSINLGALGPRSGKIAAAICKLGNVSCRVAGIGSRLRAAGAMHFVASTENISYACELGEFSRMLNDPVEGLEVEKGLLKVPSGPGVGVSLRS